MTTLAHGTWIAVCDGGKAMLLENNGDELYPKLELRQHFENDNPPSHEQGSDGPGRAFSGAGGRHAAMSQTDLHDEKERGFLKQFADRINRQSEQSKAAIVLIAPPRALGMVRPHLTEHTRQRLLTELARDYVRLPLFEIERLLAGA